jgi:hypothetical protein
MKGVLLGIKCLSPPCLQQGDSALLKNINDPLCLHILNQGFRKEHLKKALVDPEICERGGPYKSLTIEMC